MLNGDCCNTWLYNNERLADTHTQRMGMYDWLKYPGVDPTDNLALDRKPLLNGTVRASPCWGWRTGRIRACPLCSPCRIANVVHKPVIHNIVFHQDESRLSCFGDGGDLLIIVEGVLGMRMKRGSIRYFNVTRGWPECLLRAIEKVRMVFRTSAFRLCLR